MIQAFYINFSVFFLRPYKKKKRKTQIKDWLSISMRKASSLLKQSTREIDSFSEWRANVKKCLRKIWIYQSLVMSKIKKENLHSFEWKEPWRKILSFLILAHLKWSILLLLCILFIIQRETFFQTFVWIIQYKWKKIKGSWRGK